MEASQHIPFLGNLGVHPVPKKMPTIRMLVQLAVPTVRKTIRNDKVDKFLQGALGLLGWAAKSRSILIALIKTATFNFSAFPHSSAIYSSLLAPLYICTLCIFICILPLCIYLSGEQVPGLCQSHFSTVSSIRLCLKTLFFFQTALICIAISSWTLQHKVYWRFQYPHKWCYNEHSNHSDNPGHEKIRLVFLQSEE